MARLLLVARNAFRGIMSRRAVYIWGLAVMIMLLRSAPAIFMRGEPEMLAWIRAGAVSGALDVWSLLCLGAAILLGAGSMASEFTSKTIVTLLARPVRRWEVLAGKWLGVVSFAVVSMAIGTVLALGLARYLGIDVDGAVLAVALTHTAAAIVLFGGVAVALSAAGSAPLAVAFTVLLLSMPGLIRMLQEEPGRTPRAIGAALDYATPPGYRSIYRDVTWAPFPRRPNTPGPAILSRPPDDIDYKAQGTHLLENAGYAGVYFLIGCFFFTRRDVKLG